MRIFLTSRYALAFAALTMLCGTSNEFVIAGELICLLLYELFKPASHPPPLQFRSAHSSRPFSQA